MILVYKNHYFNDIDFFVFLIDIVFIDWIEFNALYPILFY